MKIDEKEIKEFESVEKLANAIEQTLDNLVFELQKSAVESLESYERLDKEGSSAASNQYEHMLAYTKVIRKINEKFDMKYITKAEVLKQYLEKPVTY